MCVWLAAREEHVCNFFFDSALRCWATSQNMTLFFGFYKVLCNVTFEWCSQWHCCKTNHWNVTQNNTSAQCQRNRYENASAGHNTRTTPELDHTACTYSVSKVRIKTKFDCYLPPNTISSKHYLNVQNVKTLIFRCPYTGCPRSERTILNSYCS